MAHYASTQAGDWDDTATWGGSGPPGDGDTCLISHAVAVDQNTTIGTFLATGAITGATQANPVVITDVAHGLANNQRVLIKAVGGMTQINKRIHTVANKADDTFELSGENGTGHGAYTSGGTWELVSLHIANPGSLTIETGVTFTIKGHTLQGNAGVTLQAGASLVFDTTSGTIKYLRGDAANFTNHTSAIFLTQGTSGSHCTVSKTGSNFAYFDAFDENAGADSGKTGWDCTYTDFTDIDNAAHTVGLASNNFGEHHQRFDHCTFTRCGPVMVPRPFTWAGTANKDNYIRDCTFEDSAGSFSAYVRSGSAAAGSGAQDITRTTFDKSVSWNGSHSTIDCLYLRGCAFVAGTPVSISNCLFRLGNGDTEQILFQTATDCYWLSNLNHPGNPHCLNQIPTGKTISGWIFENPNALAIDGGECVYVNGGVITVTNNLVLPSETDGYAIGNVAHNSSTGTAAWVVEHNTIVGRNGAAVYTERASDTGTLYSSVKSNLVYDHTGNNSANVIYDVFEAVTDAFDSANSVKNGLFGYQSYADSVSGETLIGYRSHFTVAPGDTDVIGNPNFVDITRNFANWSVHKGAANGGDSLTTRTNATIALLKADPTLLTDDLMPWVREGFRPTNAIYLNAGHDGVTIGAFEHLSVFTPVFHGQRAGMMALVGGMM